MNSILLDRKNEGRKLKFESSRRFKFMPRNLDKKGFSRILSLERKVRGVCQITCRYIILCDRPFTVGHKLAQMYKCLLNYCSSTFMHWILGQNKNPPTLQMLQRWTDTVTLTGNDFLKLMERESKTSGPCVSPLSYHKFGSLFNKNGEALDPPTPPPSPNSPVYLYWLRRIDSRFFPDICIYYQSQGSLLVS